MTRRPRPGPTRNVGRRRAAAGRAGAGRHAQRRRRRVRSLARWQASRARSRLAWRQRGIQHARRSSPRLTPPFARSTSGVGRETIEEYRSPMVSGVSWCGGGGASDSSAFAVSPDMVCDEKFGVPNICSFCYMRRPPLRSRCWLGDQSNNSSHRPIDTRLARRDWLVSGLWRWLCGKTRTPNAEDCSLSWRNFNLSLWRRPNR